MYVKYLSDFSDAGKCMQDCGKIFSYNLREKIRGILQKSEIMFGKSYQQEVNAVNQGVYKTLKQFISSHGRQYKNSETNS